MGLNNSEEGFSFSLCIEPMSPRVWDRQCPTVGWRDSVEQSWIIQRKSIDPDDPPPPSSVSTHKQIDLARTATTDVVGPSSATSARRESGTISRMPAAR